MPCHMQFECQSSYCKVRFEYLSSLSEFQQNQEKYEDFSYNTNQCLIFQSPGDPLLKLDKTRGQMLDSIELCAVLSITIFGN